MWLLPKVYVHFRSERNRKRNSSAPCDPQKKQPLKKQVSKQLESKDPVTRKSANLIFVILKPNLNE